MFVDMMKACIISINKRFVTVHDLLYQNLLGFRFFGKISGLANILSEQKILQFIYIDAQPELYIMHGACMHANIHQHIMSKLTYDCIFWAY